MTENLVQLLLLIFLTQHTVLFMQTKTCLKSSWCRGARHLLKRRHFVSQPLSVTHNLSDCTTDFQEACESRQPTQQQLQINKSINKENSNLLLFLRVLLFGFLSGTNSLLSSAAAPQTTQHKSQHISSLAVESGITEQLLVLIDSQSSSRQATLRDLHNCLRVCSHFSGLELAATPLYSLRKWQASSCVSAARKSCVVAASMSSMTNLVFLQPKFFLKPLLTSCWIYAD